MGAIRFCAVCKQEIEQERQENDPKTVLCDVHAKEIEKYGGENKALPTDERLSKGDSLKINYGAVSVKLVRNQEGIDRLREDYLSQ